jgi:FlaA1/EpsC-like NDP-sugar epimerase
LIYENGLLKIAGITVATLLLTYYFDLYGPRRISESWEIYFRLLLVLSTFPFCLREWSISCRIWTLVPMSLFWEFLFLTVFLVFWRWAYDRIIGLPIFSERVYVLGSGQQARAVVETLRASRDAGMEVVGWKEGARLRNSVIASPRSFAPSVDRSPASTVLSWPWKTAGWPCRCGNCLSFAFAAS